MHVQRAWPLVRAAQGLRGEAEGGGPGGEGGGPTPCEDQGDCEGACPDFHSADRKVPGIGSLVKKCFLTNPEERPTAGRLHEYLNKLASKMN